MNTVLITDVTLRDGLQIVPRWVSTPDKLRIAQALPHCGVRKIELTSFTSPKAIPSLADADELASLTTRDPQVCYTALVPNLRGAQRALAAKMDELNFVFSASEAHNQANLRMSIAQSLAQLEQVL
ncbi:hydroxymethylglutaryl-CoA lyase, partial [Alcaligenes pakistanensis]